MFPYSVHCAHIYYFIDIDRQSYDQTLGISNTLVSVNALVICCNISIASNLLCRFSYAFHPSTLGCRLYLAAYLSALNAQVNLIKLPLDRLIISPSIVGAKANSE